MYLRQRNPAKQMTSATSPWDACRAPRRRRVLAWVNDIFLIKCANCLKFTQRKEKKNSRLMSYIFCFSVSKEFPVRAKVHVIFEQPSYVQSVRPRNESSVWKMAALLTPLKARVTKSWYWVMLIFFIKQEGNVAGARGSTRPDSQMPTTILR